MKKVLKVRLAPFIWRPLTPLGKFNLGRGINVIGCCGVKCGRVPCNICIFSEFLYYNAPVALMKFKLKRGK